MSASARPAARRPPADARAAAALLVVAAWTLFAFAGVVRWTTVPFIVGASILTAWQRPALFRPGSRALDAALIAWIALTAATLVPLPAGVRAAIAPAAARVDAALYLDAGSTAAAPWRPLSFDPLATRWALAVTAALVLLFWCGRDIAARHGQRTIARGVAWIGLALSALAIVQHGTAPDRLYWWIRPVGRTPRPFGPFVNRNDLATWLMLAMPLVAGYALARVESRRRGDGAPLDVEAILDATELGLVGSLVLMLAALLVTTSRSGLLGAVASVAGFMWLARGRVRRSGLAWLAAALAAISAVAATYASWNAIAGRVEETMTVGLGGRREIWERTWAMASDFPIAGVGAGAYERAMSVYQHQPHVFYFNHAHNEYLQLAAEGGLLLAVPAAIAAWAAARQIARLLAADRSAMFWIRAGAASGLIAVAVQGIWDTGLQLPANAVLFAIVAALAVQTPEQKRPIS